MQAPRRVSNLERATSNASASSGGVGAGARETPRMGGGRLGSEAAGIGSRRGGRASRGDRRGWGGGRGGGGGGRSGSSTLLPSTNMQLSNAFHVSLSGTASAPFEAALQCSLVSAGDFESSLYTCTQREPLGRIQRCGRREDKPCFPLCHGAQLACPLVACWLGVRRR